MAAAVAGEMPWTLPAQQRLEVDAGDGLDEQRVQEQLAELAVPGPRLAGRRRSNEPTSMKTGPGPAELDVVRGGVFGDQPFGQRLPGEVELQPGRVPQHLERPLVGVGDDVEAFVAQSTPAHGRGSPRRSG